MSVVSMDEVHKIYEVNVFGVIRLCQAVLPFMRQERSGVIANLGSIGGWHGGISGSLYCSTKAALAMIIESLHYEAKHLGIQVCIVEPGYFRTEVLASGSNRQLTAKRIADYDESVDKN